MGFCSVGPFYVGAMSTSLDNMAFDPSSTTPPLLHIAQPTKSRRLHSTLLSTETITQTVSSITRRKAASASASASASTKEGSLIMSHPSFRTKPIVKPALVDSSVHSNGNGSLPHHHHHSGHDVLRTSSTTSSHHFPPSSHSKRLAQPNPPRFPASSPSANDKPSKRHFPLQEDTRIIRSHYAHSLGFDELCLSDEEEIATGRRSGTPRSATSEMLSAVQLSDRERSHSSSQRTGSSATSRSAGSRSSSGFHDHADDLFPSQAATGAIIWCEVDTHGQESGPVSVRVRGRQPFSKRLSLALAIRIFSRVLFLVWDCTLNFRASVVGPG